MTPSSATGSEDSEKVVPPEEELTAPPTLPSTKENEAEPATPVLASHWLVVAKNQRVNKDWEALTLGMGNG